MGVYAVPLATVVNPFLCMLKQFFPIFMVVMTVDAAEF
jgi:hypothetical protein